MAGRGRHGTATCLKKWIVAGRDECNVAQSGQRHRSLFPSRYVTMSGSMLISAAASVL
jgi:hypothetical protein